MWSCIFKSIDNSWIVVFVFLKDNFLKVSAVFIFIVILYYSFIILEIYYYGVGKGFKVINSFIITLPENKKQIEEIIKFNVNRYIAF